MTPIDNPQLVCFSSLLFSSRSQLWPTRKTYLSLPVVCSLCLSEMHVKCEDENDQLLQFEIMQIQLTKLDCEKLVA